MYLKINKNVCMKNPLIILESLVKGDRCSVIYVVTHMKL